MKNFSVNAFCMSVNNKGIWFVHGYLPVLMFFDFGKQKITINEIIPNCKTYQLASFCGICEADNKIFLIPNNASVISVYDKKIGSFTSITIDNKFSNLFWGCFINGNSIYCLPYKNDSIAKIDIQTLTITKSDSWHYLVDSIGNKILHRSVIVDNMIMFVLCETNQIIIYDFINNQWISKYVGNTDNQYTQITKVKDYIYLFDNKHKKIYKYNQDFSSLLLELTIDSDEINMQTLFDCILIDYMNKNDWFILDENLNLLKSYKYEYQDTDYTYNSRYFFGCWEQFNDKAFCITPFNQLIEMDRHFSCRKINLAIESKSINDMSETLNNMQDRYYIDEHEFYYFDKFINSIVFKDSNDKLENQIGKKIYESI